MSGLFVTATDTGVGKTVVACALARATRARGLRVGVLKPFESGCETDEAGALAPIDAAALREAAGVDDTLDQVCPHRYAAPLAPGVAAETEGGPADLSHAVDAFVRLEQRHGRIVVEGAGGLLVPLTERHSVADLAVALGLPLVIVARAGLGTLNHGLLTVEAARARGLDVAAVILNEGPDGTGGSDRDPSVATNARVLARLGGVPVLGPLPAVASTPPDGDSTILGTLAPLVDALAR